MMPQSLASEDPDWNPGPTSCTAMSQTSRAQPHRARQCAQLGSGRPAWAGQLTRSPQSQHQCQAGCLGLRYHPGELARGGARPNPAGHPEAGGSARVPAATWVSSQWKRLSRDKAGDKRQGKPPLLHPASGPPGTHEAASASSPTSSGWRLFLQAALQRERGPGWLMCWLLTGKAVLCPPHHLRDPG